MTDLNHKHEYKANMWRAIQCPDDTTWLKDRNIVFRFFLLLFVYNFFFWTVKSGLLDERCIVKFLSHDTL